MLLIEPKRVSRRYRQQLHAEPDDVFSLLCPVREMEWVRGWKPLWVRSSCGLAEPDCIFKTRSERGDTTWVITRHEPENYELEMVMFTPGHTIGKLQIRLHPADFGHCSADVTYSYTSLGPEGDRFLETFTEEHYKSFMTEWENELNTYLATGKKIF